MLLGHYYTCNMDSGVTTGANGGASKCSPEGRRLAGLIFKTKFYFLLVCEFNKLAITSMYTCQQSCGCNSK